jgi:hypothetical protein
VRRARPECDTGHISLQIKPAGARPAARTPAMPATARKPHGREKALVVYGAAYESVEATTDEITSELQ